MKGKKINKYIKSEKGGMGAIIAEIVLAAIVLSLLLMIIIPAFNKNREMIGIAARKENELGNVKSLSIIDLGKDEFSGNDVIATVRYYSEVSGVTVEVTTISGSYLYDGETYDENIFSIPRGDMYIISLTYTGEQIQGVVFNPE
jgi:hypothetical protein